MREFRAEAKTIEDAIEQGLEELGIRRENAVWKIEQEPKSGFLGIGSKKAIVIVKEKFRNKAGGRFHKGKAGNRYGSRRDFKKNSRSRRENKDDYSHRSGRYGYEDARLPQPEEKETDSVPHYDRKERHSRRHDRVYIDEPLSQEYMDIPFIEDAAEHAKEVLMKLLTLMGVEEPQVLSSKLEEGGALVNISFTCKDPSEFTSFNGRMLQSMQFMLNTIINRKREPHLALCLDTDGYWDKRKAEMEEIIKNAVSSVKASGHVFRLDPMPAAMRKLAHTLVQEKYPEMSTYSEGEGRWRKVVVCLPADNPKKDEENEEASVHEEDLEEQQPSAEKIEENSPAENQEQQAETMIQSSNDDSAETEPNSESAEPETVSCECCEDGQNEDSKAEESACEAETAAEKECEAAEEQANKENK